MGIVRRTGGTIAFFSELIHTVSEAKVDVCDSCNGILLLVHQGSYGKRPRGEGQNSVIF
jgi:hypothetical protein